MRSLKEIDGSTIEWAFEKGRKHVPREVRGKQCFLYREGPAVEEAKKYFGREKEKVALKIFFLPCHDKIEDYYWGTPWRIYSRARTREIGRISTLLEATTVQNLCWMEGFAPRVYGLVYIKRGDVNYPAQLVDIQEGEVCKDYKWMINQLQRIEKYLKQFGCERAHLELVSFQDYLGKKLIDFQGFRFGPKVKDNIRAYVKKQGRYGKGHYQSVPE